jgi:streptogramin lyase
MQSVRRLRTAKLLAAAVVAAGLLSLPAPALGQSCTLGYDTNLNYDRKPSPCSFFSLSGAQAAFPITAGPDGRLWFFVHEHGALYAAKMTTGGQVDRFPLPAGSTPDAITAGPDGALWYAGDGRIGRLDTAGGVTEFPVPALRATGIAAGPDGALWVAAGTVVVRVTPQGAVSVIPLDGSPEGTVVPLPSLSPALNATASRVIGGLDRGATSYGITAGGDGAMWIAAGSHLARVTGSGDVRRIATGSLSATGGITTAADGTIWFAADGRVGRYDPASGGLRGFGVTGHAVDIVRGPGNANVWVSTATTSGRLNWITRMSTRDFSSARPRGWSCAGQSRIVCWYHIRPLPMGDARLFTTHGSPGGVAVGPDGNIWYTEGGRVGRILTFRGAMPCYERVTRSRDFGCGRNNNHSAKVTHSGYAYLRTSCPRLTFRACGGDVVLKTMGGRFVSRAVYIISHYDNPKVRVVLPRWIYNLLKHRSGVLVKATYTSQDMGGNRRVNGGTWYLSLVG